MPKHTTHKGGSRKSSVSTMTRPNPARVYLASRSPSGRLVMARALAIIARDYRATPARAKCLGPAALRTRAGRSHQAREEVQARHRQPIPLGTQGVLRVAWRLGAYPGEELERVRDVRSVPGSALPVGRALSKGELKALMDCCSDGSPMGARDAAVIALGPRCRTSAYRDRGACLEGPPRTGRGYDGESRGQGSQGASGLLGQRGDGGDCGLHRDRRTSWLAPSIALHARAASSARASA